MALWRALSSATGGRKCQCGLGGGAGRLVGSVERRVREGRRQPGERSEGAVAGGGAGAAGCTASSGSTGAEVGELRGAGPGQR